MAFDAYFGERITKILDSKKVDFFSKPMMGGLLFMMDNKMLCGIHIDKTYGDSLLMARIGEVAYEQELKKGVCLPMNFTVRPMRGYIYVTPEGYDLDEDLEYWIQLCIYFNTLVKQSPIKNKKIRFGP